MWDLLLAATQLAQTRLAMSALLQSPSAYAVVEPCKPHYQIGGWVQTGSSRRVEGLWVVERVTYEQTRTELCDGTTAVEYKTEGPFRLWRATPADRVDAVNDPLGADDALSGSPLRSTDPSGGPASGGAGKAGAQPSGKSSTTKENQPALPGPYLPAIALLVGLLVAMFRLKWRRSDPATPLPEEKPSLLERFRFWADRTREDVQDRWEDAKAWTKYVAWPWLKYAGKATGLYAEGLVFEIASDLGFGVGHLFMNLIGRGPDSINDAYFQMGRKTGAKTVELWGYLEILIGILKIGGGALATATVIGAPVGVPAVSLGIAAVAAGPGHIVRGRLAFEAADQAYRRTGGESAAKPPLNLLTEEEVRTLLGPDATEKAVSQFMRFQEYVAEKVGKNFSRARVRAMLEDKGVGPLLKQWVEELGPEKAANLFHRYEGRKALLGAITENRFAASIAKDETKVVLKVNIHSAHPGADVVYIDLVEKRLVVVEAKGSVSGTSFNPHNLREIIVNEMYIQNAPAREALTKLVADGKITPADKALILSRLQASEASVVLTTGGSAAFSDQLVPELTKRLQIPAERMRVVPLD